MKYRGLISRSAIAVALVYSLPVLAQEEVPQDTAVAPGQTIIVTGTRRTDRTVAESPTPIDVYSGQELQKQGVADMNQVLQNLVPSFTVARYAIGDGSSFVRPPNLRGLAPCLLYTSPSPRD